MLRASVAGYPVGSMDTEKTSGRCRRNRQFFLLSTWQGQLVSFSVILAAGPFDGTGGIGGMMALYE
jgi:hypothetical protein